MKKDDTELEKALSFCTVLKFNTIKEEIKNYVNGFYLNKIKVVEDGKDSAYKCYFNDSDGNYIHIIAYFNEIKIFKQCDDFVEYTVINSNLLSVTRSVDRRDNGVVCSVTKKQYVENGAHTYNRDAILFELQEDRYVFTRNSLHKLIRKFDFKNINLSDLIIKLFALEVNKLEENCDYRSKFYTKMRESFFTTAEMLFVDDLYTTNVRVNGEDVSHIYSRLEGDDRIYRILDLYHGRINHRNEKDLDIINIGLLSRDAYDLKGATGITKQEDLLIGERAITDAYELFAYLKKLFSTKYGYTDEIKLDRASMIKAITYQRYTTDNDSLSNTFDEEKMLKKPKRRNIIRRLLNY